MTQPSWYEHEMVSSMPQNWSPVIQPGRMPHSTNWETRIQPETKSYKVLQDIKAFEVVASSAGFDFDKYVMLKKGEIVQGKVSTYMTGYGTKTGFFFERDGREYKIDADFVSETSGGSGGFKLGSADIDAGGINKASVTVPMLILGSVLLLMFFNQRKK